MSRQKLAAEIAAGLAGWYQLQCAQKLGDLAGEDSARFLTAQILNAQGRFAPATSQLPKNWGNTKKRVDIAIKGRSRPSRSFFSGPRKPGTSSCYWMCWSIFHVPSARKSWLPLTDGFHLAASSSSVRPLCGWNRGLRTAMNLSGTRRCGRRKNFEGLVFRYSRMAKLTDSGTRCSWLWDNLTRRLRADRNLPARR